jgi:hypothetical protein
LRDMLEHKDERHKRNQRWQMQLAIFGTALSLLILTLAGAWVEARWPRAAGRYITVTPRGTVDATGLLWQLRRIEGVRDAVAVFRGSLSPDDIEGTAWGNVWFYANQTEASGLAYLAPDPTLKLYRGQLPDVYSINEAVLSYELAAALRLGIGDMLTIQGRSFSVAGIWGSSSHLPGNFVQISMAAAQALPLSGAAELHHFAVFPASEADVEDTALRIWYKIPSVEVLSPESELARVDHEHNVHLLSVAAALILAVLLSVPLLASLEVVQHPAVVIRVALLSGAAGLAAGWGVALIGNLYARRTLGLTAFLLTPKLAVAVLAFAAGLGFLSAVLRSRLPRPVSYAVTALVLAVCAAVLVTVGTLNESLSLALDETLRTAQDWVTIPDVQATLAFLRDVERLPGVLGYTVEAYGGLADEDEDRWIGPWPPSGVFYGVQYVGGEGTLTRPYRLAYWQGGPLNPEEADEAVIGYSLAQKLGLEVGSTIPIRGMPFRVVGILSPQWYDAHNDANYRIDVSLEGLRRAVRDPFATGQTTLLVPPAKSQEEKMVFLSEVGNRLNVGRVLTAEDRAADIARSYPAAWTITTADAQQATRHAKDIYIIALMICAVFLLAACALAVAGTMADRLGQDELRVGLLKALGADEGILLGDYLQTAAVLGAIGALPGLLLGWVVTGMLNQLAPAKTAYLLFTPRLGAVVFFFVVLVAMCAAIAPVSRAVRQDGTWALYYSSLARPRAPAPLEAPSPAIGNVTPGGSEG